jgi:alkaline phosphatase D
MEPQPSIILSTSELRRRRVLQWLGAGPLLGGGLGEILAQGVAPAVVAPEGARPQLPFGAMSGDVTDGRTVVWSRSDRPARMIASLATTAAMRDAARLVGPAALEHSDFGAPRSHRPAARPDVATASGSTASPTAR